MGFLDSLFGRSAPPAANIDALFTVPAATLTLEAAGHEFLGMGAVCFKANEGASFSQTQKDVVALLDADGGPATETQVDEYGYTWLINRHPDPAVLVADLHAINVSLADAGFSHALLCTLLVFKNPQGEKWGLVYLYKRGTFYPFVPQGNKKRNNSAELEVRALLSSDVTIESDLRKWLALFDAPGLETA